MTRGNRSERFLYAGILGVVVFGLYLSSLFSYLLFHALIEIVTVAIAFAFFILTWNTREYLRNGYLELLGIGYGFIALMDLVHTLAYKGMGVFPTFTANLPTQLWIAARGLQAITLLVAPLFLERRLSSRFVFAGYAAMVSLLVGLVFSGHFPDCFIEGKGLTPFKIASEYVISAILLASLVPLNHGRRHFDNRVFYLIVASILCSVVSEISFTAYVSVYGFANLLGHFAKLMAFYLIYRAILVTGLREPIHLIFRDLKQTEKALLESRDTLEEKVRERTAELSASREDLRQLNRQLRAISDCNQALLRAESEQALLDEICHIICERAGYRMTWVGFAENDEIKTIRPIAWAGAEDGYLKQAMLTWADTERGRGPAGTAIRTGQSDCFQDFATDPRALPWREGALERGYRSSISLPLKDDEGKPFGVLNIYSTEVGAFTTQEIRLLEELAGDLAFGIVALRNREESARAEEDRLVHLKFLVSLDQLNRSVRESNDLSQMMQNALQTVLSIFDADRAWLFYPCDPDAPTFRVPMEVGSPEYPGAGVLNRDLPLPADMALNLREALESPSPVTYVVGTERPVNRVSAEQFGVQSMMIVALHPRSDKPWAFGLHQCSHPRIWTSEEKRLFEEIGRRLSDALTGLRAYSDLQESEKRYRRITEGITDYLYSVRIENGRAVETTQSPTCETITGYSPGDFAADPDLWLRMVPPEDRDQVLENVQQIMQGKDIQPMEHRIRRRDGRIRWVTDTIILMKDASGRLLSYDGVIKDITDRKQAEEALRESEAKYRRIVDTASEGIWMLDGENKTTFVNDRMAAMLGYSVTEMIGRQMSDFLLDTDRQDHLNKMENRRRGVSENYERRFVRKNGDAIWTLASAVPIFENGQFAGSFGMFNDITESKRNEEINEARLHLLQFAVSHTMDELLEETLNQAEILTGSLIGFYHFVEDDQVSLTLQNWSTSTKREFCRAEGKGMHYPIDQAGVWVDCVSERRPVIHNDYASLPHRRGMPEGHAVVHRELVVPVLRGEKIRAILGVGNKPTDYVEKDAQAISLLADLAWEIAERKQTETALKEQHSTLRGIIDSAGALIFSVDRQYRYTSFNSGHAATMKALYGVDIQVGHVMPDCMTVPGDAEVARRNLDRALAGEQLVEEAYSGEELRTRSYFQVSHSPIRVEGQVIGVAVIAQDMTPRKRAEEEVRTLNRELEKRVAERTAQLEETNRELEAFAYSVSHDLRAPLRHIDGFAELLKGRLGSSMDEQIRHYITTIVSASHRMGTLINDLLAFSRTARSEMIQTRVNLGSLVREVIREFEPEVQGRNVHWQIQDLPAATGDRSLLRLVFVNLISNALKFTRTRERAEIEIGCLPKPEAETIIFVRDNGVGFDMAYVDKLFGVFQRLHGMEPFEGTGIGLANVRRVITRHGGRTWAEGKVDSGATFYFSLPGAPEWDLPP